MLLLIDVLVIIIVSLVLMLYSTGAAHDSDKNTVKWIIPLVLKSSLGPVYFFPISGPSFNTHGPHGGSQSTEGVRQRTHLPYQLYLSEQRQRDLPVCR